MCMYMYVMHSEICRCRSSCFNPHALTYTYRHVWSLLDCHRAAARRWSLMIWASTLAGLCPSLALSRSTWSVSPELSWASLRRMPTASHSMTLMELNRTLWVQYMQLLNFLQCTSCTVESLPYTPLIHILAYMCKPRSLAHNVMVGNGCHTEISRYRRWEAGIWMCYYMYQCISPPSPPSPLPPPPQSASLLLKY